MSQETTPKTKPAKPLEAGLQGLREQVKVHLDGLAAGDAAFAEKYANPAKSLDECCRYLAGEAWSRANGSRCVYIEPAELMGLAVHYYEEAEIKVTPLPGGMGAATSARSSEPEIAAAWEKLTPEQKAKAEKDALERYTLQAVRKLEQKDSDRRQAERKRKAEARDEAKEINDAWEGASLFD